MISTESKFELLPWLAEAPEEASELLSSARLGEDGFIDKMRRLSQIRLSGNQASRASRRLAKYYEKYGFPEGMPCAKIGIVSNSTMSLAAELIPLAALRHGTAVSTFLIEYDRASVACLSGDADMEAYDPDFMLMAFDFRALPIVKSPGGSNDYEKSAHEIVTYLHMLRNGVQTNYGVPAIVQTLAAPPENLFGSFDIRAAGSWPSLIQNANNTLVEIAEKNSDLVLDVGGLVERLGSETWFNREQWFAHKLAFDLDLAPAYSEMLGRLIGAVRGCSRKCLVLDLDNTVWGGVIGDDGLDGIVLGQGSAAGEAFLDLQRYALDLRERGVILAVCSKNDEENARLPFRDHPDMLLREEHITVFRANWDDKAGNLKTIADTLNIGLDAMVFLDDNPAERAHVRAVLPMVAVPEAGDDPTLYSWLLASAGYFEAVSFSEDDKTRVLSYAADTQRAAAADSAVDANEYLNSLKMDINFLPFDKVGRPRIAQLINKTNQFNLTTRRYTESEVEGFERDRNTVTLQVRLRDRFGDSGMIGVVIAKPKPSNAGALEIDSWLMSCRVLGRRVEEAILNELLEEAARRDVSTIYGRYIPTAKNGMVAEHYKKLGFQHIVEEGSNATVWRLDIADHVAADLPFVVSRD